MAALRQIPAVPLKFISSPFHARAPCSTAKCASSATDWALVSQDSF